MNNVTIVILVRIREFVFPNDFSPVEKRVN